jgi:hypothetical protein
LVSHFSERLMYLFNRDLIFTAYSVFV